MWLTWAVFVIICLLYAAMVTAFFAGLKKLKDKKSEGMGNTVSLSVIIPFCNEEQNIDFLLQSISDQDLPKDLFEIILVNDHSTDDGLQKAHEWKSRIDNLMLLDLPNGIAGKKQAIAYGIEKAKNSRIVLTDADCIHPKTWLSTISRKFQRTEALMIIGPVMLSPTRTFFQKLQALEHASLTASTLGGCAMGLPFMASSANLAFDSMKLGFDSQMLSPKQLSGDDVFLLHSAKRYGCEKIRCIYLPDALVLTKPVETLSGFIFQRARWASKAPSYRDWTAFAIAIVVFIYNLMLLVLIISSLFIANAWMYFTIGFVIKVVVDFPLLWIYLRRYQSVFLLWVFLPLQLVYPFYIIAASALSVAMPVRWNK